jgi:hypothetical protein
MFQLVQYARVSYLPLCQGIQLNKFPLNPMKYTPIN